jgi:hypothetical protein
VDQARFNVLLSDFKSVHEPKSTDVRYRLGYAKDVFEDYAVIVWDEMRRLMKFMHTMGAIGLMGAMASLLELFSFIPAPTSLSEYALMRAAMGGSRRGSFSRRSG